VSYSAATAAAFFDEYGEREWERFDRPGLSASLATHLHYLAAAVRPGDRVLDAGCGPGRFTIELARLGARVVALDVSPGQLDLHRRHVVEAGAEDAVEERLVADVCDLSVLPDGSFDVTVCFGGPLSYVLDHAPAAIAELARVTRPGGRLLVSAMTTIGATLGALGGVAELVESFGAETVRAVSRTGILPSALSNGHLELRMYRASELVALLEQHGTVVAASATGIFRNDTAPADLLAELELDLGAEPGAFDVGQHFLAVLEVRS
jgi:SAM-dependent methyltransferase